MFVRGRRRRSIAATYAWQWIGLALYVAASHGASVLAQCSPPDCIEVSLDPPGGLSPTQTPQIVVLTFDDALTTTRYDIVQQILTNHFNPNGCGIQATFFVKNDRSDYYSVNQLYAQGHEIGVHTINHTNGPSLAQWRREIVGSRKYLSDFAQIPIDEIVGFRAPYLQPADESFHVLYERGFAYDSSILESVGDLSPAVSNMIWPYTLDTGTPQTLSSGSGPAQGYPGLFEIPVWTLHDTNETSVAGMDPWDLEDPLGVLQYNFTERYEGNRAPMGLFLHLNRFEEGYGEEEDEEDEGYGTGAGDMGVVSNFISWALAHDDVWFVTMSDLVAFMRDPQDIDGAYTFAPFECGGLSVYTGVVSSCRYSPHSSFRVCGTCPPAYPSVDNTFKSLTSVEGGTVDFVVTTNSENGKSVQMHAIITNNLAITSFLWKVSFQVHGGDVTSVWSTNDYMYEVEDDVVSVQIITGQVDLEPGESDYFGLRATNHVPFTAATISNAALTFYDMTPSRPEMEVRAAEGDLHMSWGEAGFEYKVQERTSLETSTWTDVSGELYSTNWSFVMPADDVPRFYRLRSFY